MAKKTETFAEVVTAVLMERPWLSIDAVSFGSNRLPVAMELEERDRSAGERQYGFGSPGCAWRDRRDRRASRPRGHRAGKK